MSRRNTLASSVCARCQCALAKVAYRRRFGACAVVLCERCDIATPGGSLEEQRLCDAAAGKEKIPYPEPKRGLAS